MVHKKVIKKKGGKKEHVESIRWTQMLRQLRWNDLHLRVTPPPPEKTNNKTKQNKIINKKHKQTNKNLTKLFPLNTHQSPKKLRWNAWKKKVS